MGIDHSGICRRVDHFRLPWLEHMAREAEALFGADFEPFGATFGVHPIRISHVVSVGDGVGLHLDPDDAKAWDWWGCFEADVEIARRRRLGRTWADLLNRDEVKSWIDTNSAEYLRILRAGPENYPRSLNEDM